MHSVKVFSAILALGATAVSASTCTSDVKVTEATPSISCDVVDGDVIVDSDVAGDLVFNGVKQIKGDLIVNNASGIVSISSTSINSISGNFTLENLEFLSRLEMSSLKSVGSISLIKLTQLDNLNFGTEGVTKVTSIQVTDTFISDLSGLSVATVENFRIDNNRKMTSFRSDLVNITGQLIISSNGNNMEIEMNQLELASEIQISNVKSFTAPKLEKVSQSIKFDNNRELTSFVATNLTEIGDDLSFLNNKKLSNISMPALETVSGGFTIQNNTAMDAVEGFDELATVSGGIILRGDFEKVELPSLKDVKGSVTVTSTTDISDFCQFFDDLESDGAIQGGTECTSNNQKANEGGDEGEASRSGSDGGDDEEDAAGIVSVNMALLGLAGVAAVAQLF